MAAPQVHHAAGTPRPETGANLDRIRAWAVAARAAGAGLLATPELFATAEPTAPGAQLRERLRWVAMTERVGLIASTPEAADGAVYIGADWWDAAGNLVAHTRKRRLAPWQLARGFTGWDGPPQPLPTTVYAGLGLEFPVALAFAEDAADPAQAYFLRDHGVRTVLVLAEASSREDRIVPAPAWAGKHTGLPFPQSGPLPEPLLRPLPRIADAWWTAAVRRPDAGFGS